MSTTSTKSTAKAGVIANKILMDCDVVLDLLMQREPFYPYAASLFSLVEEKVLKAYVSALGFSNVFYILRKYKSAEFAFSSLRKFRLLVHPLAINEQILDLALASNFSDFEDAVQYYGAVVHQIPVLVTRNKKDFKQQEVSIFAAEEFLAVYQRT